MRCHAYVLPSDLYRDLETQILENLAGDREPLMYLLDECDLDVELLSGEWRVLFEAAAERFFQVVDPTRGVARMAISPEELADFVSFLQAPERAPAWLPISFGLEELRDALPPDCDLAGVVFVEESDDWLWVERSCEILALRPEVYELLAPHLRGLIETRNFAVAARLAADHAEGAVELSTARWNKLIDQASDRVPELVGVIEGFMSEPADYTVVREALSLVADPEHQPSLDAWLRVHADAASYALFFRDITLEDAQFAHESGQAKVGV